MFEAQTLYVASNIFAGTGFKHSSYVIFGKSAYRTKYICI